MIKKIIILIIICFAFFFSIGGKDYFDDKIFWSPEKKLTWLDFKGTPDTLKMEKEQASTSTQIAVTIKNEKTKIYFYAPCYFEKEKSWTINDTSQALLDHEQLHFDISEIYARSLRKDLLELNNISDSELENIVKEKYHAIIVACVSFQKKYDLETKHSKNKAFQEVWETRVKEILDKTTEYKSSTVAVIKN
jgi:hypothetical protein